MDNANGYRKTIVYLINHEIPTLKELYCVEVPEKDNKECYETLEFIKLDKEEDILYDIAYRSLTIYDEVYFYKINNTYYVKSKLASIDRYGDECPLEFIDIIASIWYRETCEFVPETTLTFYKSREYEYTEHDDNLFSLYHLESFTDFKLSNRIEDIARVFKIKDKQDMLEIEHRIDHEWKRWYVFIDQDSIEVRDMYQRFDEVVVYKYNELESILEELLTDWIW
ncbi:uncharacterized protein J8A68_006055 [[Candida] subhashii]|uniref:Uncharacterized protein n=1 Tax=[Candida] subhashii TaxID=561895 RepID=A0A8J5QDE0_9ASCO|nr:uncharacterized protein J8A68_006055 [[Candida] subhashii]KAG7660429.1 hypothetical protein J8A68_006055 [[Candida] subhashii]